ncbi:MAG TPA: hypothetical protein PKC45_15705 [Gemmatales bacterium]|nr:hypothetical protein [Gemmatales bacterium]
MPDPVRVRERARVLVTRPDPRLAQALGRERVPGVLPDQGSRRYLSPTSVRRRRAVQTSPGLVRDREPRRGLVMRPDPRRLLEPGPRREQALSPVPQRRRCRGPIWGLTQGVQPGAGGRS